VVSLDRVTRPVLRRIAACLATGALTALTAAVIPTATADTVASDRAPLKVSIRSLNPSTVPARGIVTLSGTITNRSHHTWRDLQVYMLTSGSPITTKSQLAKADASDPTAVVGSRLVGPGLYDKVPNLAPGASTNYFLSVPRRDLGITGAPGVYWIGVHVLGADVNGHDGIADGRARTFIPLMKQHSPRTSMSLVMPLKAAVQRDPDGALSNEKSVAGSLGPNDRLGRLLSLSATATQALTWVLDPAVVDAAESVSHGNPPMNTGPTTESSGESSGGSPSPGASPSTSPTSDSSSGTSDDSSSSGSSRDARNAASWLAELKRQAATHAVESVPYGDLDVSAALDNGRRKLFRHALDLSTQTMAGVDVHSSALIAPPSGYLSKKALARIGPDLPVLLSDTALPRASGHLLKLSTPAHIETPVILSDSAASSGGPSPGPAFSALAVRQRILSEAALHALSTDRGQTMVVSTPQSWDPGSNWRDAQFFSGLSVPWLDTVDLPALLSTSAGPGAGSTSSLSSAGLVYPRSESKAEVPFDNLLASKKLTRTGIVFSGLLARNDTVDDDLAKAAMLASSTNVRLHPLPAATRARETTHQVRTEMRKVRIDGPSFVTMSSESGTIQVTIVNGLDESVNVGIKSDTDSPQLSIPAAEPVLLGPGQRASVRLNATSQNIGVHPVRLIPVNADGQPVGIPARFTVRSSQVGLVIWVIMGVGAAVLFMTIAVRILRRVSRRRRTHGPMLKKSGV
jgi:Family of unknown function (DUF6049)